MGWKRIETLGRGAPKQYKSDEWEGRWAGSCKDGDGEREILGKEGDAVKEGRASVSIY